MFKIIFKTPLTYVIIFYYALLVLWWVKIYLTGVRDGQENYLFGLAYSFIALVGGINGILVSRKWGFYKSVVGRGILFLSCGLLAYWFGQTSWSYYNLVLNVEAPYPSIADFGYFSSIILYSLGMFMFAYAAGANTTIKSTKGIIAAVVVPLVMVLVSYYFFLKNFAPDFSDPLKLFLDYGTPLGYSIAMSIAILAFVLSRNVLGGKMKTRILFIVCAFIAEYITDYTFLYQFSAGTYYNAGINDLMFATTFMLMAIGLISFSSFD